MTIKETTTKQSATAWRRPERHHFFSQSALREMTVENNLHQHLLTVYTTE